MPYGETITLRASSRSARARRARRAPPVPPPAAIPVGVVIPCHRIVGADGSLTGYAGGLDRKQQLLELEGVLQRSLV